MNHAFRFVITVFSVLTEKLSCLHNSFLRVLCNHCSRAAKILACSRCGRNTHEHLLPFEGRIRSIQTVPSMRLLNDPKEGVQSSISGRGADVRLRRVNHAYLAESACGSFKTVQDLHNPSLVRRSFKVVLKWWVETRLWQCSLKPYLDPPRASMADAYLIPSFKRRGSSLSATMPPHQLDGSVRGGANGWELC